MNPLFDMTDEEWDALIKKRVSVEELRKKRLETDDEKTERWILDSIPDAEKDKN